MSIERETTREPTPDLVTAAASGDRLKTLIALRDFLAEKLQDAKSSRDISSMSRRLMQCVSEIEQLEKQRDARDASSVLNGLRGIASRQMRFGDLQHRQTAIDAEHENY